MPEVTGRLRRLAEELDETGLDLGGAAGDVLVEEVDHALRPSVHERRVPRSGTIVLPTREPDTWEADTGLNIVRAPTGSQPLDAARRYADGLSSWLLRQPDVPDEWLVFDRPAGSERDLGVISRAMGATVVQRHPSGVVRIVGDFGVLRWDGYGGYRERPIDAGIDVGNPVGEAGAVGERRGFGPRIQHHGDDLGHTGIAQGVQAHVNVGG